MPGMLVAGSPGTRQMASLLRAQEYQAKALVALRDAATFTSNRRTPPSGIFPFPGENQSRISTGDP